MFGGNRNQPTKGSHARIDTTRLNSSQKLTPETSQYSRYGGGGHYSHGNQKKGLSKGKIAALVILALVVLIGIWGALLVNSALGLRTQAQTALQDVNDITASLGEGDYKSASATAQELANTASSMNSEMSSPIWAVATVIPVVGSDVSGVKTFVSAIDDVASDALVPLTQALESTPAEGFMDKSGGINVEALTTVAGALEQSAPVMQQAADSLETIPAMNISQLEEVIGPAKEKFLSINELFQQAGTVAPVLGSLLGVNGERNYVIVAQNSAEIRPSGGFPGSVGELKVSNGKISMGGFRKVYDAFESANPYGASTEERDLYGNYMNTSRDVGQNPDFTRVAEIWAESYARHNNAKVDGVISVTPAVVQSILKTVGPVTLSDGTVLNGDNATKVLQHDLYWAYLSGENPAPANADLVDALFAEAAALTFGKLTSSMNMSTLVDFASTLKSAADSREIMMWFAKDDENNAMAQLGFSGALGGTAENPELGVFVGTGVSSKLGWYLDASTEVGEKTQNNDGSITYQVTTTLHNVCTGEEAATGGSYIMCYTPGYEAGDIQPAIYIFAPEGGAVDNLQATNGSREVAFKKSSYKGLQVYATPLDGVRTNNPLKPGETTTITYTVTTSPNAMEELKVVDTPTLTEYRS